MPFALITGASSGIGAATARHFADNGYDVLLIARSRDNLEMVRDEIGARAHVEALDASDGDAVMALAETVRNIHGIPDVIVNSAGAGAWKRIEETSPAEARTMMDAPYQAAFNLTHAFMADMLARRSGVIINVGSPASTMPWPASVGYAASRFALRGLNEAVSIDIEGSGVHSCHVVFGKVESAYFATNQHAADRLPTIGRLIPTISPEKCAEIILNTVRRPRREVHYPFMLRVFYGLHWLLPGVVRWTLKKTGYSD